MKLALFAEVAAESLVAPATDAGSTEVSLGNVIGGSKTEKGDRARSTPLYLCLTSLSLHPQIPLCFIRATALSS